MVVKRRGRAAQRPQHEVVGCGLGAGIGGVEAEREGPVEDVRQANEGRRGGWQVEEKEGRYGLALES